MAIVQPAIATKKLTEFGLFDDGIERQGRFASSMLVPSARVVCGFQSWLKKPRGSGVHEKSAVSRVPADSSPDCLLSRTTRKDHSQGYLFGAIKKITDGCFIFLDTACTISSRV
jgi:hypothetical protein